MQVRSRKKKTVGKDWLVLCTLNVKAYSEREVSYLVGALSPVNHKGLHQGETQTSLYLQVIHFTSHYTTSHVVSF